MTEAFHRKRVEEYLRAFADRQGDISLEQAVCELDEIYSERIADIENALCEIDEGGNENE